MKLSILALSALALFAAVNALPAEDSVVPEVMSSELIEASPESINAAKAKKEANEKAAAEGAAEEKKQTEIEADLTKKAADLKAKDEALSKKEAAADKKQEEEAASYAEEAGKKSAAASEATAKAEAASKKFVADQKKLAAENEANNVAAEEATKKRKAADKASWEADQKEAADEKAAAKKAAGEAKAANAKYLKEKAARRGKLAKALAANAAKLKKDEAAADKAKADSDAKYAKQDKTLKAAYARKSAELKAAAAKNKKEAHAAMAKIKADYAKVKAANAKKDAAYAAKEKADAAALKAARGKEGAVKLAKKKADDAAFEKDKAAADAEQAEADKRKATAKAFNARMVADQKKSDELAKKSAAEDANMASCPSDEDGNGECRGPDGECYPTKDYHPDTAEYWMACDSLTCDDHECKNNQDPNFYNEEAGVKDAEPFKPFPPETETCKDNKKAFAAAAHKLGAELSAKQCPCITAACVPTKTEAELTAKKHVLNLYFTAAASCNPWCIPGTATFQDESLKLGKKHLQTSNGVCVTKEVTEHAQESFARIKNDKDMGTNGRFKASPKKQGEAICTMFKSMVGGFLAGGQLMY